MRKIFWLLILIPVFMTKVNASEIYYSDYGDYSEFQEDRIVADELTNVIEETRFLWYKEILTKGDYKLYNESENFSNDCYETEFSSWYEGSNYLNLSYRTYETRTEYNYKIVEGIRYIHLYNLHGSYGAIRIPELSVLFNGEPIEYDFECIGCWDDFEKYIHNGTYIENKSYIDNGGSLTIDLGKEYPINKIEVLFYIFDLGSDDKKFTLGFSKNKNILFEKDYVLQFSDEYLENSKLVNITIDDIEKDAQKWTTTKTTYQYNMNDFVDSYNTTNQYRYKDKYCKIYLKERQYSSNYSVNKIDDFIYKDEDKSKKFYSYQKRDKIEIDVYEIRQRNFNLNNFVIYSSSPYQIDSNINWDLNDDYYINFKINSLAISKTVSLNLDENTIKQLKQEIEQLNKQIENNKAIFEQESINYENKIELLQKQIDDLNEKIVACNLNCEFEKECLNNIIKENGLLLKEYENQIFDLSNEINDAQLQIENNLEQIKNLENSNQQKTEEIKGLIEQLNILKDENIKLNNLIETEYKKNIENLIEINNQYSENIKNLEEQLENKENETQLYKESIESLKQINSQFNDKISQLGDIVEELEKNNSIKETENKAYKIEIERLSEINNNYYNQIIELESDIGQINENNSFISKQYENKISDLNDLVEKLKVEIKNFENDISNLVNEKDINLQKEKDYQIRIENLEKLNKTYEAKIKELEEDLKQNNFAISKIVSECHEKINDHVSQNQQLKIKLDNNEQQISEYKKLMIQYDEENTKNIEFKEIYNDYVLKVNLGKTISLILFILLIITFIITYVVHIMKKKSNEKKV